MVHTEAAMLTSSAATAASLPRTDLLCALGCQIKRHLQLTSHSKLVALPSHLLQLLLEMHHGASVLLARSMCFSQLVAQLCRQVQRSCAHIQPMVSQSASCSKQ